MEKYKICPGCGRHYSTKTIECRCCEMSLAGIKPVDEETEEKEAKAEDAKKAEKAAQEKEAEGETNGLSAPSKKVSPKMVRICSECGTDNPPNARKCISCGEDISDVVPTPKTGPHEEAEKPEGYFLQSFDGNYLFEIPETGCLVGRENDMSDYLEGKYYVSRKHAAFLLENGKLLIENFSSTNYTYVNNRKIEKRTELKEGDEIGLGGNISGGKRQERAAYFIVKTSCPKNK